LFYLHGLQRLPASTAGLFLNLIPVFGLSGACLWLQERLTAGQWLGAALILAAVCGTIQLTPDSKLAAEYP
jgi:drug/metabolite transporter (DMT)-like permease